MTRNAGPAPRVRVAELLEWKDQPTRESLDIALRLSLLGVAAIEALWFTTLGYLIYDLARLF
jgi:hypothetical protein